MKQTILGILGLIGMMVLGYLAAVYAQDIVWLLFPGLAVAIVLISMRSIFRKDRQ
jgi:hypothetical protein